MKAGSFLKKTERLADFGIVVSEKDGILKCHFVGDKTQEPTNVDTCDVQVKQCFKTEVDTNFLKIKDHPKRYRWFLRVLGIMSEEEYMNYETPPTES